ncbi:hypothetical protein [Ramlibacter algicola]|uniref:Uncharacterized protein n=1 Tax=Ramlibacter algicola TaxID=2795217 RepID=A0A934URP8_9BURK|nr:hypothetical protein [Ramlibacter algicola]MBK0392918.1 hypothetical protein [Ramlibacter algicola]
MIEESRRLADDWKQAEEAQKEAEALLKEAWHSYFSKDGRAPSAELIAEVTRLRRIAEQKLQEAIECAQSDVKALDRR